jgi:hypothetical protein
MHDTGSDTEGAAVGSLNSDAHTLATGIASHH